MKEVVYISVRNTKISSKGNFSKPLLLNEIVGQSSLEEIHDLAEEDNVRFFDEDGETIEVIHGVGYLKMMIENVQTEITNEADTLLFLYDLAESPLATEVSSKLQNEISNFESTVFELDKLKKLDEQLKKTSNVGILLGPQFESYLPTTLLAYLVTLMRKKNVILIMSKDTDLTIDLVSLKSELLSLKDGSNKSSSAEKLLALASEKMDNIIRKFQKNTIINTDNLEEITMFL